MPAHSPSLSPSEWRRVAALTALLLLAASLPYVLAYLPAPGHVFAGILFNPLDGQSYLAKMREGWRGAWLFTLPYTAEPGPGVLLFTYYLFLGHVARWLGLGVEVVYLLARVVAGAFLLLSAYAFLARFFETARARLGVWLLFAAGSGLGWLAVPFGAFTSDLWVAEAFPFLSVLSNSHFCLTLGLMLWIFDWAALALEPARWPRLVGLALATTALAQLQPMMLLVLGSVLAVLAAGKAYGELKAGRLLLKGVALWPGWRPLAVVGGFAAPWVLYDVVVSGMHPQLAAWSVQNVTPSPPVWDALLAGGVPLALAVLGAWVVLRRRQRPEVLALVWLGVNILLVYAPLALQRRLSLGIWMPVALLAGVGWREVCWPRLGRLWRPLAVTGLALLVLPSNLLVFAALLSATPKRAPEVFLTRDEAAALAWLDDHAGRSLVLASPAMGLFIPSHSDARVLYGHPLETTDAAARRQAVEDFFAGRRDGGWLDGETFLADNGVSYIFYGSRERALGAWQLPPGWAPVFAQGEVTLYGR